MAKPRHIGKAIVFTSLLSMALGAGIVLVAEDMAGVPYTAPEQLSLDPSILANLIANPDVMDFLVDLLERHPEWIEPIGKWLMENFDLTNLSPEDLATLIRLFPGIEQYLGALLLSQLLNGGEISNLPEPRTSGGLAQPNVDNGDLNLDLPPVKLYTLDSNYRGTAYIRSCSWGDYDPVKRTFFDAPEYDGSTYLISPALFTSYPAMASLNRYEITFHLAGHRDYGTLVGDVTEPFLSSSLAPGGQYYFSPDAENRAWLVDLDEYTVGFYPTFDPHGVSFSANSSLVENEKRYRKFAKRNYLSVDEDQQVFLDAFLRDHNLRSPDEVCNYLKYHFDYADQSMNCPADQDIIEYFLYDHNEGTCTNFASAATLLCRELGVPTRFTSGYLVNLNGGRDQEVTDHDAHAWIEVYEDGTGWRRLDPTPSKPVDEPETTEPFDGNLNGVMPSEQTKQAIFDYRTDAVGEHLYFRSYSYGDYDPVTATFKPDLSSDPDESSLLTLAQRLPERNAKVMNIMLKTDFVPLGMMNAGYSLTSYSQNIFDHADQYVPTNPFIAYNDQRFARAASVYSHLFHPDYNVSSITPSPVDTYYSSAVSLYTRVPTELVPILQDYLSKNGLSTVEDIMASFTNYMTLSKGLRDGEPIQGILTALHQGNEKSFAGALTLLVRSLGIPARYVEGYYVSGEENDGEGSVSRQNSHNWVEVYRRGVGWQRFDPEVLPREVYRKKVSFQTQNVEIIYDGLPHSVDHTAVLVDDEFRESLRTSDSIEYEFSATSQEKVLPGNYPIRLRSVLIRDYWGNELDAYYPNVETVNTGKLTIRHRPITVVTNDVETDRGYEPMRSYEIGGDYGLAPGHYVDETALIYVDVPIDRPGESDNLVENFIIRDQNGNDVTSNYQIQYTYGKIKVNG